MSADWSFEAHSNATFLKIYFSWWKLREKFSLQIITLNATLDGFISFPPQNKIFVDYKEGEKRDWVSPPSPLLFTE